MSSEEFLNEEEKRQILSAISEAEQNTSGEIRLFIEKHCKGEVLDRAAYIFGQLDMHKTENRNGVLFYFATLSHKFAILGDAGINSVVPVDFWDMIKEKIQKHFSEKRFADGLIEGLHMSGEALKKYFPRKTEDKNELSDEIVFGKE